MECECSAKVMLGNANVEKVVLVSISHGVLHRLRSTRSVSEEDLHHLVSLERSLETAGNEHRLVFGLCFKTG